MFLVAEAATYGIVEVHSVSHSFPMHGCKGSVWLDGSGKVGWQSRFRQNLPPAERIQPENLVTACHTLEEHPATETSDWREIRRKKRGTAYRRSGILMLRP